MLKKVPLRAVHHSVNPGFALIFFHASMFFNLEIRQYSCGFKPSLREKSAAAKLQSS